MTQMAEMSQQMRQCIDMCHEAHTMCGQTMQHALAKGGPMVERQTMMALMDCADMCSMCADMCMRQSRMASEMSKMCAEACRAAADTCSRFDDPQMRTCAEMTRKCADMCEQVAMAR
ncbi:four-helix bundle copper-binding protein [Streptomyces halobius]|uniref:Four-helix bundle copper-binding protein n=1 Tax=Streptomyces halobius TaxID=2879846 RepID=A0ABY4M5G5_9ACTN|nr:four-helix bundle copper-binding protein [Streptomyces halobius]UQA91600.1 four-helix bundle copper-binding protein [Streptomyces halobius]